LDSTATEGEGIPQADGMATGGEPEAQWIWQHQKQIDCFDKFNATFEKNK